MGKTLQLVWNKCRGGSWCELFAIDADNPYFRELEGVYVVWHGGREAAMVRVGQGLIRERILFHRADPEVLKYQDRGLFMTWASVAKSQRDGVERFLAEALRPKVKAAAPAAAAVPVNLPGRGSPGKAGTGGGPQAEQVWEETARREGEAAPAPAVPDAEIAAGRQAAPAAAPAAPPLATPGQRLSKLQKQFNALMEKAREKPSWGFFGGGGGAKSPENEVLVVDVTQMVLREAMLSRASDIHLEPWADRLRVRFRIDGILEEVLDIPHALNIRLASHFRVMCGLDPEKGGGTGKPQDGRMVAAVDGNEADLRLATFPTAYGDKVVLRILPRRHKVPELEELGLRPVHVETVRQLIARPQGMIIVTGPSGSGKSTTLYTILHTLNAESRNIVTLEDPVEVNIPGITQGAIQPNIGFTFAGGLRAILRQDPNVIMVGESRDSETAEIAMRAALTGHLIFTTLHTNSALGAVTRLLDMGIEPFLIASAVTAVYAQRLARRLCGECREAYQPAAGELAQIEVLAQRAGIQVPADFLDSLHRSKGCPACRDTGFKGRVLLFEAALISAAMRPLILRKATMDEMHQEAVGGGMENLLCDGLHKVKAGLTTLDEVIRVVGAGD